MRPITLLIIAIACLQTSAFCQRHEITIQHEKKFRVRFSPGVAISFSVKAMENHFREHGFNDKLNAKMDWLYSGGNDFFPQSMTWPVIFELAVERKLNKGMWAGLTGGIDEFTKSKGYDRYGTDYGWWEGTYSIGRFVTMKHWSWFLSPQIHYRFPNGDAGLFGGPTITFHSMGVQWDTGQELLKHPTKLGGIFGLKLHFGEYVEGFVAYRFSQPVVFNASSEILTHEDKTFTSTLPALELGLNHVRIGLSCKIVGF